MADEGGGPAPVVFSTLAEQAAGASPASHPERRCARHPGRPAVDDCPVCGRPRCAPDAARGAGRGCPACRGGVLTPPPGSPVARPAALVRLGVGGALVALAGAAVGADYVGTRAVGVLLPLFVGVLLGVVAATATGRLLPAPLVVPIAGAYGAASAAYAFRFAGLPFGGPGRWLPPVLAGLLAAAAVALLLGGLAAPRARPGSRLSRRGG